MRDEKDSGTLDMIPAKRGRPVLYPDYGPMTPAEKQRGYRERVRSRAKTATSQAARMTSGGLNPLHDYTLVQLLEAIRQQNDLLARMEASGGRGMAPAKKRIGALVGELARRYPQK